MLRTITHTSTVEQPTSAVADVTATSTEALTITIVETADVTATSLDTVTIVAVKSLLLPQAFQPMHWLPLALLAIPAHALVWV